MAGAPIVAGVDLGVYARNGVDVSVETFTATPQIMTALAAGQLDFGQVTIGAAAFNAYQRGVDLLIISAGSIGTVPVIVRKDLWDSGAVRSVQDLKDRTIAINGAGNILEYAMYKLLQHGGLTPADVQVALMPFPDMVTALQNQAIDAAMMLEPTGSQAVSRGVGVILEEKVGPGPADNPWYAPGLQAGMLMANLRNGLEARQAANNTAYLPLHSKITVCYCMSLKSSGTKRYGSCGLKPRPRAGTLRPTAGACFDRGVR